MKKGRLSSLISAGIWFGIGWAYGSRGALYAFVVWAVILVVLLVLLGVLSLIEQTLEAKAGLR